MKKNVSYNVKVRIAGDAEILNADCECASGMGPQGSCKHSAAICLMLSHSHVTEHGEILIEKSSTEKLQTFHRPHKLYKGKVSKMQDLYPSPQLLVIPPEEAASYADFAKNAVIGYCASTSQDLAMRYLLYPKADIAQATREHDYLELPFTEYWIDKALQVSDEEANEIQWRTTSQSSCKRWFKEREWRITASKFGEIVKATSRRNYELLCEDVLGSKSFSTPAILHGRTYETAALHAFTSVTGIDALPCGFYIDAAIPYLGATPDARVLPDGIVEVKCPYKGRNLEITADAIKQYFPFLAVKMGK